MKTKHILLIVGGLAVAGSLIYWATRKSKTSSSSSSTSSVGNLTSDEVAELTAINTANQTGKSRKDLIMSKGGKVIKVNADSSKI